ncbi:hypothetical protein [Kineosporia babensis]|uniref:Uncharacterized protein n=1 Tax=Kineosporia babensis TaxID=499548 RepID=A0A9X1SSI7_9ACTN|nr:hypothetical protein [Kineosporia babensis]MCD5310707.1 hypothetical protein [Kineosporia babensis]
MSEQWLDETEVKALLEHGEQMQNLAAPYVSVPVQFPAEVLDGLKEQARQEGLPLNDLILRLITG